MHSFIRYILTSESSQLQRTLLTYSRLLHKMLVDREKTPHNSDHALRQINNPKSSALQRLFSLFGQGNSDMFAS